MGAEVTDWYCRHCTRKYGLPPREHSPERESLAVECEIPGCKKPIYSMSGKAKNGLILCKFHEITEKSKRSKIASKALVQASSRPLSKPIKKSKLYTVKYDEDMQEMKRKPGRKPGDLKKKPMLSNHSAAQSALNNKPTARTQGVRKSENMLATRSDLRPHTDMAARGPLYPRTDNSIHIPKSRSNLQPQWIRASSPNTNSARVLPEIYNGTTLSPSPEYEPPSPAIVDDKTVPSPEYEPPSPAEVDDNANIWQSEIEKSVEQDGIEQDNIEQDDSPGSQIKDELRAMQESAKKVGTEPENLLLQDLGSPFLSGPLSNTKQAPERFFTFPSNNNPGSKTPLFGLKEVVKESSSVVSSISPVPAVRLTTKPSQPMLPKPGNSKQAKNTHHPNSENDKGVTTCDWGNTGNEQEILGRGWGNRPIGRTESLLQGDDMKRDALHLAQKRKASTREDQEAEPHSTEETKFRQKNQQNLINTTNKLAAQPSWEMPSNSESSASQLQQKEPIQKEPTHTAPLYGEYKPHTIEYQRQLRCKTYDPSVLDHYLSVQIESQARAEVEREQNLMPQPETAAKTQIWGSIDPRIVWPKEQSEGWYEAKRKEIDARGGKKANFGILLTAQVRKERSDRGWHPNQNKEYVPKQERNGGSIFTADVGAVDLAVKGGKLGVLVPMAGRERKSRAEKEFIPGDR
ncbi:0ed57a5b-cdea-494d-973b-08ad5e78df35 [Sclerotinia trifoliorum]|uniref:0ed57a5b-cdea-494d-973b-08ad5e78df35 n=1 Tax=Sclerotinia trifoliorum TaxID=28548 RepID=A0A8H2VUS4_9HELO|nr:0ed57a5b-cdea-494d-973b-08ad5e78df35 [Sclerotinia trifoliorum]